MAKQKDAKPKNNRKQSETIESIGNKENGKLDLSTSLEMAKKKRKVVSLKTVFICLAILLGLVICSGIILGVYTVIQYKTANTISYQKTVGAPKETLKIELPLSDIKIKGENTNMVTINFEGPDKLINNLNLKESEKQLSLTHKSFSFPFINSFNFIRPEKYTITGTIIVPENVNLELDLSGLNNMTIENINSKVKINISGAGKIEFVNSTTTNTDISISGKGEIILDKCIGEVKMKLSGAGTLTADDCNISNLEIDSSGYGNVDIKGGSIQNAKIDLSGTGIITIPEVRGKLDQNISGAGKIKFIN